MFFQSLNKNLSLIVGFLVVSLVFSSLIFPVEAVQAKVWIDLDKDWVYDVGEPTYDTIQAAIDAASQYDWIGVNATLYNPTGDMVKENVVVNKRGLYIKSVDGTAIVNASGTNQPVFKIIVENVIIEGFSVVEGTYGIYVTSANNCNLTKNKAYNNRFGIFVYDSDNCILIGNHAYNNKYDGIFVEKSVGCVVLNNFIANNARHGIWLDNSNQTYIVGNTIANNKAVDSGIHIDSYSTGNKIHYNNILDNTDGGSYGVFDEGFPATIATYNWWGDPSGPYPTGQGDAVNEWVEYKPWLNESITKAKYTIALNAGMLDALDEANITIHYNTTKPVEIYVANYTGNP
ncbi:hypothetical protein CW703_06880, partial [Candidatus Bathyarchaeota archaeon]